MKLNQPFQMQKQEEITVEYCYESSAIKRIEILTKAEFDMEKEN
jgi:hypothetical protein